MDHCRPIGFPLATTLLLMPRTRLSVGMIILGRFHMLAIPITLQLRLTGAYPALLTEAVSSTAHQFSPSI